MKNVTMRDIGAALGVSTVTISKALGGKEGVSDAVREKIIETAKQMGYQYIAPKPDDGGRVIGILIADRFFSAPSFYASLYRALLKELADVDMLGALEIISDQDEESLALPVAMTIQRVSGFVLLGQFAPDYVSNVLNTGLPTVLLDFTCDGPDVDAVVSDGQVGTYQLTRYLIEHGHKRIGFVGNIYRTTSIMDRYSGFLRAMMHEKLPLPADCVIPDSDISGRYYDDFDYPARMPTALVCNNDMLADRVIESLEKRGLSVPEDVSVVGFDDFVCGKDARLVTTYAVDQQRMAQVTVRRLQSRMREGLEGPLRTLVGGWFVERDTVMDLNTHKRCGRATGMSRLEDRAEKED